MINIQSRLALVCASIAVVSITAVVLTLANALALPAQDMWRLLLWPGAAALVLAVAFGWFVGGQFSRVARQVSAAAGQICSGNLDARAPVSGGNEAVRLAKAFNSAVSSLIQTNLSLSQQLVSSAHGLRGLETALEERTRELSSSHDELEKFVSVAAHDLRAPLRSIMSFGEMLTEKDSGLSAERSEDYLRRIMASADRMHSLIADLKEYASVSHFGVELEAVDLSQILERVCKEFRAQIEDSGATVNQVQLPSILGCPNLIILLFRHLVGNSLKYAREAVSPAITIEAAISNNACTLTFTDNGIGFEGKYAERIFEAFQRLHHHSAYPGTGMGLALCRKVVQIHGGEITAQPGDEFGARFIMTFGPQVLAEPLGAAQMPPPELQHCAA